MSWHPAQSGKFMNQSDGPRSRRFKAFLVAMEVLVVALIVTVVVLLVTV